MSQLILTIIFYVWLFAILALLVAIWRSTTHYIHTMEQTLLTLSEKNAETAKQATETTRQVITRDGQGTHPLGGGDDGL